MCDISERIFQRDSCKCFIYVTLEACSYSILASGFTLPDFGNAQSFTGKSEHCQTAVLDFFDLQLLSVTLGVPKGIKDAT